VVFKGRAVGAPFIGITFDDEVKRLHSTPRGCRGLPSIPYPGVLPQKTKCEADLICWLLEFVRFRTENRSPEDIGKNYIKSRVGFNCCSLFANPLRSTLTEKRQLCNKRETMLFSNDRRVVNDSTARGPSRNGESAEAVLKPPTEGTEWK
jgi:hypothetical protein